MIIIIIILFLLITGALLWFGGFSQFFQKPSGSTAVLGDFSQNNDEVGPRQETTLPLPPPDFATLNQNNPDLRPELKSELVKTFEDLLVRLEKEPDSAQTWADLGSVKYAFMDYKGAEALWLYTLELNPDILVAHANLGELYWHKLPNYPKAEEAFLQLIERDPMNALRVYKDLSDLYRYNYKEKADLADDVFLDALKKYPENPNLLSHLARLYMEEGKTDLAIEYFERVLAVIPDNESAREELGRLRNR